MAAADLCHDTSARLGAQLTRVHRSGQTKGVATTTLLCSGLAVPVQALFLKTADSVSLPIYQVLPDVPTQIE